MRLLVDDKGLAEKILSVRKANKNPFGRNVRGVVELAIRETASEVQEKVIHLMCKRCRDGKTLTLDMQKEYAHLDHPGGIFHRCGAAGLHTYFRTEVS